MMAAWLDTQLALKKVGLLGFGPAVRKANFSVGLLVGW